MHELQRNKKKKGNISIHFYQHMTSYNFFSEFRTELFDKRQKHEISFGE